jgi:hypothetical protein
MSGACTGTGAARLSLSLIFKPHVAGGTEGQFAAECAPLRLEAFGTRELACRPQQIVLTRLDSSRVIQLDFHTHSPCSRLALPFCDAGVCRATDYAESNDGGVCAQSTAIVVNLYARTWTECGQAIWTSLGGALMPLAALLNMRRSDRVHRKFEVVLEREIDADSQPAKPPIKGTLEVTRIEVSGEPLLLRSRRAGDVFQGSDEIEAARRLMAAMIQRGQDRFFGPDNAKNLQPTIATLRPFHVPTNQTDFMLLPSSSYTMLLPREPLNVPYYEQLLRIALRRSQLSEADALQLALATRDGTGKRAARAAFYALVIRMLCVFALSQCYMDDITNMNEQDTPWRADLVCSDEDFKICRLCGGDDCEGCALEPHMHVNQLCAPTDEARLSPLLRLVRSFLRTFVPCLALGCVTNKQMSIERLDQSDSLAHTFAVLMPLPLFARMLSAEQRAEIVDGSRFATERAADVAAWRGIDECPLVCEGTAPIDPAMRLPAAYYDDDTPEVLARANEAVAARRAFVEFAITCLKKTQSTNRIGLEISGATALGATARDQSTFYKYVVSLTSNAFADRLHGDFLLVYRREGTFGVRFADFINGTDAIALNAYLAYTKEEAAVVDAVLADQQPVPNLILPAPAEDQRPAASIERLQELARRKPPVAAAPDARLAGARLHQRFAYATLRLIDLDATSLRAIEAIANGPLTRSFEFQVATVSAAVDGTRTHNWIVDVYFTF